MTTIAYRDGVLAADTGAVCGASRMGRVEKIIRGPGGILAGACGLATYSAAFKAWVVSGCIGNPPVATQDADNCDRGFVVSADGVVTIYEEGGSWELSAPYFAVGSGRPEALGAMFAGADAETAVRAAMEHDAYTFGDVMVLRHAK